MPQGFAIEIPPKVEVEGRDLQRRPQRFSQVVAAKVKFITVVWRQMPQIKVTWRLISPIL